MKFTGKVYWLLFRKLLLSFNFEELIGMLFDSREQKIRVKCNLPRKSHLIKNISEREKKEKKKLLNKLKRKEYSYGTFKIRVVVKMKNH